MRKDKELTRSVARAGHVALGIGPLSGHISKGVTTPAFTGELDTGEGETGGAAGGGALFDGHSTSDGLLDTESAGGRYITV